MSENLIYGADITAYGAVADGKTDCSDAFIKAIENGENLIVLPYGKYVVKKALKLSSNLKIHLHPNAEILFDTKAGVCVSCDGCSSVIISGGKWICENAEKTFFGFTNSSGIKISDCNISGANGFVFENCNGISIKNTDLDIDGDCISLRGKTKDVYLKSICAYSCVNVIDIAENAEVEDLYVDDISLGGCKYMLGISGSLENVKMSNVYGDFLDSLVCVCENAKLEDTDIEDVGVCCLGNGKDAYLDLRGSIDGLEIANFKRNSDCEAKPFIPTLVFRAKDDSTAIIDGMMLDHVINARALSKTVDMTTARLTNPTNKFIYTLECGIKKNDTLTIPLGDFDTLTIYKR